MGAARGGRRQNNSSNDSESPGCSRALRAREPGRTRLSRWIDSRDSLYASLTSFASVLASSGFVHPAALFILSDEST
jgi:hypothetical protein